VKNPNNQKKVMKRLKMKVMLRTKKSINRRRKKKINKNITIQNLRQKIPPQMSI